VVVKTDGSMIAGMIGRIWSVSCLVLKTRKEMSRYNVRPSRTAKSQADVSRPLNHGSEVSKHGREVEDTDRYERELEYSDGRRADCEAACRCVRRRRRGVITTLNRLRGHGSEACFENREDG
jgi:hypothetical protein